MRGFMGSQESLKRPQLGPSALVSTPHMPPTEHAREHRLNARYIYSAIIHEAIHWSSSAFFMAKHEKYEK